MPFQKGHPPYTNGRPRKGESIKELLNQVGVNKKRDLVKVAYEHALAGNVQWADWIARHSGEGAGFVLEVAPSGLWTEMMQELVQRLAIPDALIDAEVRVLPLAVKTPRAQR